MGVRDIRVVNSFSQPKQTANLNTPAIRIDQNYVCAVADGSKQPCLTLLESVSLWQQQQQQQQIYRSICQSEDDFERCYSTFSGSQTHSSVTYF